MSYWEALLYGAVQGVAEYLPISSSAHLILLPRFLGRPEPGLTFDVFLHIGTLAATLWYFRRDWLGVLKGLSASGRATPAGQESNRLLACIIAATIPALIAGALLNDYAETVFRSNWVLVVTLPLGGFALYLIDRLLHPTLGLSGLSWSRAIGVGFFQCLALVPGMSRSGSTMMGARALGLERGAAARFSFLISAPVTGAAIIFKLRHFGELLQADIGIGPLVVAGLGSFVFGLLAIDGLLRLLKRFGFMSFAVYRAGLAFVIWWVLIV